MEIIVTLAHITALINGLLERIKTCQDNETEISHG